MIYLAELTPKDPSKYTNPLWFYKGMEVLAHYKGTSAIKCIVQIAAGDDAFVINEKHNFSGWFNKRELLISV